jgi:hypothetical protein
VEHGAARCAVKQRKLNKRKDGHHVRFYDFMLNSLAYLSLSCQARAVLIEFGRVYDGSNNGRLGMSIRTLARRCGIAPGTAMVALAQLQDRGFLELVKQGAFSLKSRHASEWRVTMWPCNITGAAATTAFTNWGKNEKPVSNHHATVPNQDHSSVQKAA